MYPEVSFPSSPLYSIYTGREAQWINQPFHQFYSTWYRAKPWSVFLPAHNHPRTALRRTSLPRVASCLVTDPIDFIVIITLASHHNTSEGIFLGSHSIALLGSCCPTIKPLSTIIDVHVVVYLPRQADTPHACPHRLTRMQATPLGAWMDHLATITEPFRRDTRHMHEAAWC
jgi:hypothetical protein